MPADRGFTAFYEGPFRAEHRHPGNIRMHIVGCAAGAGWLLLAPLSGWPWLALLFPAVHAAPGLLGHRLYERNAAVGDLRITRKDYPLWMFIVANHRLAWEVLTGRSGGASGR